MTEQHSEICDIAQSCWVVIPAYNEAHTVRDVVLRARQQCANVIVVDDGSTDGTAGALVGLDVILLRNGRNLGKAGSLCRGFELALEKGATGVITLDADGQHAPEEIPLFIAQFLGEPDALLVGVRCRDQRKTSFWRYGANRVADFWIRWAAGSPIEDSQSGFRLYPAGLVKLVRLDHDRARSFVYESEILIEAARQGFAIRQIPITVTPRGGPRPSHFRPLLDIVRISRMVAGKLLGRGLYLNGLRRSLRRSIRRGVEENATVKYSRELSKE